jgi:AcrR family transcriptional regulator
MAKIKQSPKLPPEQRRQQLLRSASRLFLKHGYRGTTTEQIARNARLTKGALYHHFKSKEDVLFALLEERVGRFVTAINSVPGGAAPADFLRALLAAHSDDLAEFKNTIDIWVQGIRIPRIYRYLRENYEALTGVFADRVDKAYGHDRSSRLQLGVLTFAFFDGLAARKSMAPDSVDVESQLKLFAKMIDSQKTGRGATNRR